MKKLEKKTPNICYIEPPKTMNPPQKKLSVHPIVLILYIKYAPIFVCLCLYSISIYLSLNSQFTDARACALAKCYVFIIIILPIIYTYSIISSQTRFKI